MSVKAESECRILGTGLALRQEDAITLLSACVVLVGRLVGLARETVNIGLQDFRQRGLIEIQGRRIRITDESGLRSFT